MSESNRTDKFDRAIIALLQTSSIPKAAAALGIDPATLWRWWRTPEFQKRLSYARCQVFSDSLARLRAASNSAVDVLVAMMKDPKTPPGIRLRACQQILKYSAGGLVLEELKLEDFPPNGAEPSLSVGDERSELNAEDQISGAGRLIDSGDELEKKLLAASPEQVAFVEEFLESVLASRRQSASADRPSTPPATGPDVHSDRESSPDGHHSAKQETPAVPPAEKSHSPNRGTAAGTSANLKRESESAKAFRKSWEEVEELIKRPVR